MLTIIIDESRKNVELHARQTIGQLVARARVVPGVPALMPQVETALFPFNCEDCGERFWATDFGYGMCPTHAAEYKENRSLERDKAKLEIEQLRRDLAPRQDNPREEYETELH